MPKECLEFGFVDYVIMGEGEMNALDFTNYLLDKNINIEDIPGLGFKRDGQIILNPKREFVKNMDEFRQDWDLVDVNRYFKITLSGEKLFYFITSRGCPHSCAFCYNQIFNNRRWRSHSVEFVVKEIADIKEKIGINCVSFDDDNFFTNRKRGLQILRELHKLGITCQWVEVRVDYVEEELIKEMVELGVNAIFMGWESGSANTLKRVAKGFTPELILDKTRILSKFKNLTVDASAIIGFPWETKKDMSDTVSLAVKMFEINPFRMNFNIGLFIPFPGAPTSLDAHAKGFSFPTDYEGWNKFDILTGEMDCPWMTKKEIKYYANVDKYVKLLYVHPHLKFPIKQLSYAAALMAYLRLKTRILFFPFELWLTDIAQRQFFKKLEKK